MGGEDGARARSVEALDRRVDELEEALRGRDQFIATVGHELRNPATPLVWQVRLLLAQAAKSPTVPSEALRPRLEALSDHLAKFLDTLDRILDVSRLHTGSLDLVLAEVDLADVARGAAQAAARELELSGSRLTLNVPEAVIGTWDRLRLEQITANLLSNAIRYGLGAPIELSVVARGANAVLTVRDQGVGVPGTDQERIFQPFERADGARRAGGLGVGLWLVQRFCNAMGGTVALESREDDGATFTVTLPRGPKSQSSKPSYTDEA